MATYSTSLKLTLIGDGEQTGTWGQTTNSNFGTLLEQAIVGQTTIIMANADYTLTDLNGTSDEARNAVIIATGNQNATYNIIVPAVQKLYMVTNSLNSSASAYIKPSGGSVYGPILNGKTIYLYCTGTTLIPLNYVDTAGTATNISGGTVSGTTGVFSGSVTAASFIGAGTGLTGTATSLSIGGNAATATTATTATTVSTTVASGAVGTTQTAGDNSTKIATTAYVATAVTNATTGAITCTTLSASGQVSGYNVLASNNFIGPGTGITGTATGLTAGNATTATNLSGGTVSASTIGGTTITASTQFSGPGTGLTGTAASLTAGIASVARNITNSGGWSVTPSGTKLYFNYNGTNVASLDSSGNLITLANITAYGTP